MSTRMVATGVAVCLALAVLGRAENAFEHYQRAVDLLPVEPRTDAVFEDGRELAPEAAWAVKDAQAALDELRLGLALPCVMPAVTSFDQPLPYLAGFRRLGRALVVEGWMYEDKGEWARACQSYRDLLKLGQDTARGGGLIHKLVSIALEGLAWRELEQWVSRAMAREAELRELLGLLQKFERNEVSYADVLQREFELTGIAVRRLAADPKGQEATLKELGLKPGFSAEDVLGQLDGYFGQAVKWARKPYPEACAQPVVVAAEDRAAQALMPAFKRALDQVTRNTARCRGMQLLVALKLYRLRQQTWPADLRALVPEVIPQPLTDPFTGEPFHYRVEDNRAIVYSLGPNQRDDGGVPLPAGAEHRQTTDIVFVLAAVPRR